MLCSNCIGIFWANQEENGRGEGREEREGGGEGRERVEEKERKRGGEGRREESKEGREKKGRGEGIIKHKQWQARVVL